MKNKILYILCFTFLGFIGCKKENTTETTSTGTPAMSNIFNTHKDYFIIGEKNHIKSHFNHLLTNTSLLTTTDGKGIATIGDVAINNVKLPNNPIDLNNQFIYSSIYDKTNTISFAGNTAQDFNAVNKQIYFVKPLQLISPKPNDNLSFDEGSDLELKWISEDIDDDMLLEIRSVVMPTNEQKLEGMTGYQTLLLKDVGTYSIPADVLSAFCTTQGIHITLYRFTNDEVVSGNRTLDFITYSSYSGLFRFKPSL